LRIGKAERGVTIPPPERENVMIPVDSIVVPDPIIRLCGRWRGGLDEAQIDEFLADATSSDYNALLATCCRYVDIQ
jgi:hypothetical protein